MSIEHECFTSGNVPPSTKPYKVTHTHDHRTLRSGDVVIVVETPPPEMKNLLLRLEDSTLHSLRGGDDGDGDYVHLEEDAIPL